MPINTKYTMKVDATSVATAGRWVPLNQYNSPFNVSIGGILGSAASGTYRIEHTFDDVNSGQTVTAFVHADMSANSTNADGNYAYPITAVRLVVVSAASAMTVSAIFSQTGV